MKKIYTTFSILLLWSFSFAQTDPYFGQAWFTAPVHINPAMAGNTPNFRLGVAYRNQQLGSEIISNSALVYGEANIEAAGLGIAGTISTNDMDVFTGTYLGGAVSYRTKNDMLRFGIRAQYVQHRLADEYLFLDQLSLYNDDVLSSADILSSEVQDFNFIGVGAGVVFNHLYGWAGLSVDHLGLPGVGSITSLGGNRLLPMRIAFNMAARMHIPNAPIWFYPEIRYISQGTQQAAQFGVNSDLSFGSVINVPNHDLYEWSITAGFWLGNLLQSSATNPYNSAMLSLGLRNNLIGFGGVFSYMPAAKSKYTRSQAFEISLIFEAPFSFDGSQYRVGGMANQVFHRKHTYRN